MRGREIPDSVRVDYEKDGFLIIERPILPETIIEKAVTGTEAVRARHYETGIPPQNEVGENPLNLCKINDAHLCNRSIYALITQSVIGAWAAAITGARFVQVWATQLLIKPSLDTSGGNVGWHQDRQYWTFWEEGSELLTAWIALSAVTRQSGPLCFIRGSHRWGYRGEGDFFNQNREAQHAEIGVPEGETWEEEPGLLPPGGLSFHHCLTFHGSGPNSSGRERKSFAVHLRTEKAKPVSGSTQYWVSHLDDPAHCPVIFEHCS